MTLITKIPGAVFSDDTLPKLYRDKSITAGTQWAYDSLDTYSWAKQAAPLANENWKDISPVGGDATLSATGLGFAGGFTKNAPGYFSAPTTGKVSANAEGLLFILWLKYGLQPTSGYSGIAGCFDSNNLGQYGLTVNNDASNGNLVASVNSVLVGSMVIANHPVSGTILQIALSLKRQTNGSYVAGSYKNGVLLGTSAAGNSIQQPTTPPRIGYTSNGVFSDTFIGTFYRSLFDDTSTLADQSAITALVLKDYNANVGRFA